MKSINIFILIINHDFPSCSPIQHQWRNTLYSQLLVLGKAAQWMAQCPRRKQESCALLQFIHCFASWHRTFIDMQFFRRTALVQSIFTSYNKILLATGGSLFAGYVGWLGVLRSQQGSEFNRLVTRNDCGSTPVWKNPEAVVNLREKDYKTFMNRRDGV